MSGIFFVIICIFSGVLSQQSSELQEFRKVHFWQFRRPHYRNPTDHEHAYVAICIAIKNQHLDIREWIEYHHYIGVNKFYVYDDMSMPPMLDVLTDFVRSGLVSYHYLGQAYTANDYNTSGYNSAQKWAYNNCLHNYYKRHVFIGAIDVDEFVVLKDGDQIQTDFVSFLQQYEDYGAIRLFWRVFGSSGRRYRQNSTLLGYTNCITPYDSKSTKYQLMVWQYKTFVNTRYSTLECKIHDCYARKIHVNTNFEKMWGGPKQRFQYITWDKALIHHYMTKSKEEQREKTARGFGNNPTHRRGDWFYQTVDEITTDECLYMKDIAKECCHVRPGLQMRNQNTSSLVANTSLLV